MQLDLFQDGQGNTHHDMYTLSMTKEFANDIYSMHFQQKIDVLVIDSNFGKKLGNKKLEMYYEKEIYTFRKGYIFRYEIEILQFRKSPSRNIGKYTFGYRLMNVYQQKKETIEPVWNLIEPDKVYMEKEAIEELLKNYKRKDKYKFIERF